MKQSSEDITKLCKVLSEKCRENMLDQEGQYELINLVDDLMLVWCREDACFYAKIIQSKINDLSPDHKEMDKIQSLALSKPPIWDVKRICLNRSGTGVLLIGNEGVAVVELPKRWGFLSLFEGGVDTLTCRVKYVGEEFLACNPFVKIVSADWHPGALDHTVIIVLASDNYLRLYNLAYLDIPEKAFRVAKQSNFIREGGKFGVGECAVAFGVGPPTNLEVEHISFAEQAKSSLATDKFTQETEQHKKRYQDLVWPIFILHNNGDVFYTLTYLYKRSIKRRVLYGPISMLPASFDNYGVDFCSLLVLPSTPAVLVIGNTKGYLHHCIVMETSATHERVEESCEIEDLSLSVSQLNLEMPGIYLHVYESIHLNLSYVNDSKSNTSHMALTADPSTPARYWASHKEGCHGISVPLVERLIPQDVAFPENDLESRLEHLICTQPIASASPCAVMGVCASLSGTVFCLLSSGIVQAISLPTVLLPNVPSFHLLPTESDASALRKAHKESFEDRIRHLLQRATSQPLLISGIRSEIAPEEYLNLFTKVTNTLRENYIRPQIKAREELRRRHSILQEQKEHLKRELSALEEEKNVLTDKAHELAEIYEEANDRHSQIMKRLELIVGNLVRRMPLLSVSERVMLKELQDMTDKSKSFQTQLNQIKSKHEWQIGQIEKEKSNKALRRHQSSLLSENQLTCLKLSLGKESDKLEALVKKINQVKKEIGI